MLDKREHLLHSALPLFITQGFHGTSVQTIVRAAGVATGSFYRYFDSKEALISALFRLVLGRMCSLITADVDLQQVNFTNYRQLWFNACAGIRDHADVMFYKDLYERSPYFTADDQVWAHRQWAPLNDFFRRGSEQGLFRDLPPMLLGTLSLASVQCVLHEHRFYDFELTDDLKAQMAEASWQAILAVTPADPPASGHFTSSSATSANLRGSQE